MFILLVLYDADSDVSRTTQIKLAEILSLLVLLSILQSIYFNCLSFKCVHEQ